MINDERFCNEICSRMKEIRIAISGDNHGAILRFSGLTKIKAVTWRNYEKTRVSVSAIAKVSERYGISTDAIIFGGSTFNREILNLSIRHA